MTTADGDWPQQPLKPAVVAHNRDLLTTHADELTPPVRDQPRPAGERNDLLRRARLRKRSAKDPSRAMSQSELAEAVTAHVQRTTGRDVALDRHYISRWERGGRRRPEAHYRSAFRAVLGAATDAELGFYIKRRALDRQGGQESRTFSVITRPTAGHGR